MSNLDHGKYQALIDELYTGLLNASKRTLNTDFSIKTVQLAFQVADHAHYGQFRKDGAPYISHPLAVATVVAQWAIDEQTIASALLHDVIEDTAVTKEYLLRIFGHSIAELVENLSKLDSSDSIHHTNYLHKLLLSMARDVRVVFIKLADRMHNMMTLEFMKPTKQHKISIETMEIYVPIAYQLGLYQIYLALAEESFKYIYPIRYRLLTAAKHNIQNEILPLLRSMVINLEATFISNAIVAKVIYKSRTSHNIYYRMLKTHSSFKDIYDFFEIKIIVNSTNDCYIALGILHSIYQPINKFKDYIAHPKQNGYQSLHSTIIGPERLLFHINIRTVRMDDIAERGIISRCLINDRNQQSHKAPFIARILELQKSTESTYEFLENIKMVLSPQNIYTFTPKGKMIYLVSGASPIDFAYAVHTDIGKHFSFAIVNSKKVGLDYKLHNGDTVEIITNTANSPKEIWLSYAKMKFAITKIKKSLRDCD